MSTRKITSHSIKYLVELVAEIYGIDVVAFEVREHDDLCCTSEHARVGLVQGDVRKRPS